MTIVTGIVAYTIIWMLTLFVILPLGVRTHDEIGETPALGHAESAPVNPRIGLKFMITTLVAAVLFGIYWVAITYDLFQQSRWFE